MPQMQSYRYCRVPPVCSTGFVLNRLAGQPLQSLTGGRTVVPLLHPQQHGLPFALTLELHTSQPPTAAAAAAPPPPPPPAALDRTLYALHYVLAGSGQLVRHGGGEQLQAGDAVLMHQGAAACCAGGAAEDGAAAGASPPDFQLAELVAYMPQELFEAQRKQQKKQHAQQVQQPSSSEPRASLTALLAVLGSDGSSSSSSSPSSSQTHTEAGHLSEEVVSRLLLGASETARQALHQDTAAGTPAQPPAAGAAQHGWHGGRLPPPLPGFSAFQALASSLAGWWEQHSEGMQCPVTKRTLSDLTAFRLPNQSNRLAIQFDPLSRPQVPFISGVEVFEPGHRTTPHVHPQAHELFFILSGHGTGFCGEERFPVRAGDVVVFRPGAVHGIDNSPDSRMYCLELMLPNEQFAEMVRSGSNTGGLSQADMCVLAAIGCR